MAIDKDDNSPAHQYAENWRKKRKEKMSQIMNDILSLDDHEIRTRLMNFMFDEFPQYFKRIT